jgi:hypothetical protein
VLVRIIATPPGEAPEEVRRGWVGLELPLAAGEAGPREVPTSGVLSGPRTFLGRLLARLARQTRQEYGYVIDAPQALFLLAGKAPRAAQWWRAFAPHCWRPGYKFVFRAEVCAKVRNSGPGEPPAAPARAGPEEFFPVGPAEVTQGPTRETSCG